MTSGVHALAAIRAVVTMTVSVRVLSKKRRHFKVIVFVVLHVGAAPNVAQQFLIARKAT